MLDEEPQTVEVNDSASVETGTSTPDRATLEANVAARLAATFAGEGDDVEVTVDQPVAEEPAAETAELENPETPEIEAEAAAVVEEPKTAPAVSTRNAPTLPASYRRSLKAYEWTDEEIDSALKQGGQNFITTAGKLHATRSKEVAQWAELGRQKRPDPASKEGTQTVTPAGVMAPLDVAALKKKYGNEAIIDDLVGPLNAVMKQINDILPQVQQTQQASRDAQAETLGRQIDGFFGSKELESHANTYGTETGKLSQDQLGSRNKVLELADALIGGAKLQGRALGFNEAMQLAHDSVTSGSKEQAARQSISKTLVKRQSAITLKPQARGAGAAIKTGPAKNRADLEANVKRGLAAVFG